MAGRIRAGSGGALRRPVLVTGFEPFGGEEANPSWEAARRCRRRSARARIEGAGRTHDSAAIEAVADAIERLEPRDGAALGQAGGRAAVCMERMGINVDDAATPTTRAAAHGPADRARRSPRRTSRPCRSRRWSRPRAWRACPRCVEHRRYVRLQSPALRRAALPRDERAPGARRIHPRALARAQALTGPASPRWRSRDGARGRSGDRGSPEEPVDAKMAAGKLD